MLLAKPDAKFFVAWLVESDRQEEAWSWASAGMSRDEVLTQLERAAEAAVVAVPEEKR